MKMIEKLAKLLFNVIENHVVCLSHFFAVFKVVRQRFVGQVGMHYY